jgi:ribonuclease P/MRP protein subunit RPP40
MGHLDPKQPPVKRKPYAAILAIPFVHKVRIPQHRERHKLINFSKGRTHSPQGAL